MKKFFVLLLVVAVSTFLYAGSGVSEGTDVPNGKPFQTLQAQIDNLVGQVDSMEGRLDALESAVLGLQSNDRRLLRLIRQNADDIQDNSDLIAAMQVEIDALENAIALKQDILNGTCPAGQAVIAANAGSLVCGEVDGDSTLGRQVVYSSFIIASGSIASDRAYCPADYTVSGGGFDGHQLIGVHTSRPYGDHGWQATFRNIQPFSTTVSTFVICIKFQ